MKRAETEGDGGEEERCRVETPTTPEPPAEEEYSEDLYAHSMNLIKGKKRARRAKGKRKKQKTCLMITNDDGTNSTTEVHEGGSSQQKKVYLRPSNNPLLRAPKNSTQFIIDDHENSQHFLSFQEAREAAAEEERERRESVDAVEDQDKEGEEAGGEKAELDDDKFGAEFFERDFESVYETAHQEEVYSWERPKLIDEIKQLEMKQRDLLTMLSHLDPHIYLQSLQKQLSNLQDQNRRLKLTNFAERFEREQRGGRSRHSSPRLPDSTSGDVKSCDGSSSSSSSSSSSASSSSASEQGGGCSSGCCLARPPGGAPCDVANLEDVEDDLEDGEERFEDLNEDLRKEKEAEDIVAPGDACANEEQEAGKTDSIEAAEDEEENVSTTSKEGNLENNPEKEPSGEEDSTSGYIGEQK